MPIIKTPKELRGTAGEDEWSRGNQAYPLSWVLELYDDVVSKIEEASVLDSGYNVIVEGASLTGGDIKRMTLESRNEGKIFYIFHMSDMSATTRFDIKFIIANALIIVMAGKRYLVVGKGGKENLNLESIDFHFIKIPREKIPELIGNSSFKEVI